MNQTIDILMAVYNNGHYILAQLQSLMQQTYSQFRIIIRDDCSSDNSVSLIQSFSKQYPNQVLFIQGKENLGACGNFGELMRYAEAPYIMFCDADDIWLPTKVEESLAMIQKNEALYGNRTPLLVHTDLAVVDKELCPLSHSFWQYSQIDPQAAHHLNRLLVHNVMTGCTMLINRPLLQLAMPIPKEAIMHDWWIGLVASAFGKIDRLAKPTMLYRQHGKNDVGAKDWKSMATYWAHAKKALHPDGQQQLRHSLLRTIHQASRFSHRYQAHLTPQKQKIVQEYATLDSTHPLRKRYLFFKNRYFKNTIAKNIGMFFFL